MSFECESQQKFYSFDLFNCIFVSNKYMLNLKHVGSLVHRLPVCTEKGLASGFVNVYIYCIVPRYIISHPY